jgi:hypothetical protein
MNNTDARAGFTGGMVLTVLSTLGSSDIIKTIVLSAIGASVSFIITVGLRRILKR